MPGRSSAPKPAAPVKTPRHSANGIIVEGVDNCLVKFAKCCTPVPGDPVVGFITRGFGVSVHRADCPNCASEKRRPEEAGRWVKVSWAESGQTSYQTSLDLSAKDRDGLTLDVAMALSAAKVKVSGLNVPLRLTDMPWPPSCWKSGTRRSLPPSSTSSARSRACIRSNAPRAEIPYQIVRGALLCGALS